MMKTTSKVRPLALCAGIALVLGSVSTATAADSWTQWRGPTGQGIATVSGLPVTWSEKENVAWRTELPGKGWSSPVIDGNEIWMTTALEFAASPEEAKKRLEKNTG